MPHVLYAYHVHPPKPVDEYPEARCIYWNRYHDDKPDGTLIMDYAVAFQVRAGGKLLGPLGPEFINEHSCSDLKRSRVAGISIEGNYTVAKAKPAAVAEPEEAAIPLGYHVHTSDDPFCRSYFRGDTLARATAAAKKFKGEVVGPVDFGSEECAYPEQAQAALADEDIEDEADEDEEIEDPEEEDEADEDEADEDEDPEEEDDDESDSDEPEDNLEIEDVDEEDAEDEDASTESDPDIDDEESDDSGDEMEEPEDEVVDDEDEDVAEDEDDEEAEEPAEVLIGTITRINKANTKLQLKETGVRWLAGPQDKPYFGRYEAGQMIEVTVHMGVVTDSRKIGKKEQKALVEASRTAVTSASVPAPASKAKPAKTPLAPVAASAKGSKAASAKAPKAATAAPTPPVPVHVVSKSNIKAAEEVDLHDLECSACKGSLEDHRCPAQKKAQTARKKATEQPQCPHCGGRMHFSIGAGMINLECLSRQFLVDQGEMADAHARMPVVTADSVKLMARWIRKQEQDGKALAYGSMESAGGTVKSWADIRKEREQNGKTPEQVAESLSVEDITPAAAPKSTKKKSGKVIESPKITADEAPTATESRVEKRKALLKGGKKK